MLDTHVVDSLRAPFGGRLAGLVQVLSSTTHTPTLDGCTVTAGEVIDFGHDFVHMLQAPFVPMRGFDLASKDCRSCIIRVPQATERSISLCRGGRVVIAGPLNSVQVDGEICFDSKAVVIHRPELQTDLTWTVVHAFSGVFGGWKQAIHWLSKKGSSAIFGRHISVDASEEVMRVWEAKHEKKAFCAPLLPTQPWIADAEVGILAQVAENSILSLCHDQVNVVATMSPPCQPWSTGGRHQGLSCANGWAFIDGLLFGFKMQVNMMAVECADNIVNHEHFAILTQIAKQLGYRLVWAQVTPLNHLAPQMRTRWLATWVRFDLDAKYYDGRITPHVIPRTRWTDQDFSFQVPRIWEDQLLLSDSEKEFYGDVNFLPPSKRGLFGGGGPVSQTQVLYARIPKEEEPLPTLCASYTAQHELDSSHLEAKGAFAFLCMQPKGFSFFDPALFVSLLGATEDCILSAKIREAFHGLGNAIATPHALLPVMIGLLSVSQDPIDIHDMLQKCWHDRLTASNAIVCHTGNWVRIVHVSSIAKFLSSKDQANRNEHCIATAHIGNDGLCFDLHGSPNSTIGRLLRDAIRGPSEVLYAFMLIGSTQTVHLSCTAQEARSIQPRWNLSIQGVICGWVVFPDSSVPQELSPTSVPHFQDSANQSTFHAVGQIDFDHTLSCLLDLGVWRILERLSLGRTPYQWNFVLCIPDLGVSFACTAEPHQRTILCAAIQSLASISTDFCGQLGLPQDVVALSVTPTAACSNASRLITVFLQTDTGPCIWACKLDTQQDRAVTFIMGGTLYSITRIGQHLDAPHKQGLTHGMLLQVAPTPAIKAGGHHQSQGAPPSIPAQATFTQRAEFATNTHGWLAADEMVFTTQLLQWSTTAGPQYSPPVYWDVSQSEFEDGPFGPMNVLDHGTTYIPILAGDHWCALEVVQSAQQTHNITVVTVQVPPHLHTRIIMILARFLDIGPHRMNIIHHDSSWTPHLCGWELLYRWAGDHQVRDTIATSDTHNPMSENNRDMIDIVLQSAVEDWRAAGAPHGLVQFAFRLRRNFFLSLLRRTANNGQIANQRPLYTAHPPGYRPQPDPPTLDNQADHQIQFRINTRLLHIQLNPTWMHSDEIDFILEGPRSLLPDVLFCPPATWDPINEALNFISRPSPVYGPYRHIVWIIETDQHWFQMECYKSQHQATLYITAPSADFERLQPLVQQLRQALGYNEATFVVHAMNQFHPPGMCGHQLVLSIYNRLNIQLPILAIQQFEEIQDGPHSTPIAHITQQAVARWYNANAPPYLRDFALHARQWFLLRVTRNQFPDVYMAAGTQTPAPMDVTPAPDPSSQPAHPAKGGAVDILMQNDPWLRKGPKPTQSKWEDLSLQAPIPFIGADGKPLKQVHRLQVSQSRAGVVLATKTHVAELLKAAAGLDLAIVIPTTDGTKPPGLFQEFTGPYEITVDDQMTQTAYKRLALLHVAAGKASYQLATPKLKMTTSAITELVLEADSRLMTKQELDKLTEQPVATIKQHLHQLLPSIANAATYYGLRTNKHPGAPKGEQQIQCIVKVPQSSRSAILELSGRTFLLTRDFLDHQQIPQDTTVLPKFWAATLQDLADMRIATHGVEGAAGIIATRRGLALRVWAKQIAAARLALLPTDQRLTDDNRHVVPRVTIQASTRHRASPAHQVHS